MSDTVHIRHRISPKSLGSLEFRHRIPDYFSELAPSIVPNDNLHVTVAWGDLSHPHDNPMDHMAMMIRNQPQIADTELRRVRVSDVGYVGRKLGKRSLALILDDESGVLQAEHEFYRQSFKNPDNSNYLPHLTLSTERGAGPRDTILAWTEANAPESIALSSLSAQLNYSHNTQALIA